jgi:hypothetical protein
VARLDPGAAGRKKDRGRRDAYVRAYQEDSGNMGLSARELPNADGQIAWWDGLHGEVPRDGPFPCSLPPNWACTFQRTQLSCDLCRVRDGVRVDVVMACCADDERLASHPCHEGCPRGLPGAGSSEVLESGDLVDCHRGAFLA